MTAIATEVDTESVGIDAAGVDEAPRVKASSSRQRASSQEGNGGTPALKRSRGQKSLNLSGLLPQTGKEPASADSGKSTAEQVSESPNASPRKLRRNVTNERDRGSPRITPRSTTEARTSVKKRPVSEKRTTGSRNPPDAIKRSVDAPPRPSSKPPELLARPGAWHGTPSTTPTSPPGTTGPRMPASTADSPAFALANTTASPAANLLTPEKDKTPSSPNRLRVNSSPANLSPSRKPQSPGHVTTSVSTTPVSTTPRSSANSPRSRAQSPSSPQSAGSPRERMMTITKHQRSASLGQDHQLVHYPRTAGRWISEAGFNALPFQGKLMVSAFAGVQELYKAAQEKFGDKWCWHRGEVPLRQRGQAGTMKALKMRRDADYPGSLQEFENAFRKGMVKEYLLRHLKATDAGSPADVTLLAYQLDHVFAASCDLLCEALAGQQLRPKTLALAIDLICDPEDLELSAHFIKGFYRTSGNVLMVQTFVKIFSDMIDLVLDRVRPLADAFSREDMFKTFYFLGSVLMGYPASEMQDILWRVEDKEKIDLKVWKKLEEWKGNNPKELKKLDENAMRAAIEKKRQEIYTQVRQGTYGKLAALLSDRSSKLVTSLMKGDKRFEAAAPVSKASALETPPPSPYKPAKE